MQEGRLRTGVNGVDHYVKTETCGKYIGLFISVSVAK